MYQDCGGNIEKNVYFEFSQYCSDPYNKILHSGIRDLGFSENK